MRELVARRVPLYRFVLANVVQRYDLDRADGRIDAMREAAKLVTSIRDRSKVDAFSRELAGMLGIEPTDVQREVRRAAARAGAQPTAPAPGAQRPAAELPDPRDPRLMLERETLKLVDPAPRGRRPHAPRTSTATTSPTVPTARCGRHRGRRRPAAPPTRSGPRPSATPRPTSGCSR